MSEYCKFWFLHKWNYKNDNERKCIKCGKEEKRTCLIGYWSKK